MSATKQNVQEPKPPGMDKAELKEMLRYAKAGPISVALALDKTGNAILELHKTRGGEALSRGLKESAEGSRSHRFGTVSVDPKNGKLLVFRLNKAASGMAKRIALAVKGTGFSKAQIMSDDGAPPELHEEPDEAEQAEEAGKAAGAAAGKADAEALGKFTKELEGLVQRMLDVVKQAPGLRAGLSEAANAARSAVKDRAVQQAGAAIDAFRKALKDAEQVGQGSGGAAGGSKRAGDLASLVKQVTDTLKETLGSVGKLPGLGDEARKLGAEAQAAIKAADAGQLGGILQRLQGLQQRGQQAAQPAAPAATKADPATEVAALHAKHSANNDKARQVWNSTKSRVRGDLDKVFGSMDQALDGHGMADQLRKAVREKTESALAELDEALGTELAAVNKAGSPAEREQRVAQARQHLERYRKHVGSDKSIALLDQNPFSTVSIRKTFEDTLAALEKTIR